MRWLALAVAATGLAGCVVESRNSTEGEVFGDVTFYWTFGQDRKSCSQTPEVQLIKINIWDGNGTPQTLLDENGTATPYRKCNPYNVDGTTFLDFAPGHYSFTLAGVDASHQVLYAANGTFYVNGSVERDVNLVQVLQVNP